MLAEVERVRVDLVEMLEQVVQAQATVGHQIVEALHQLGLGQDRQVGEPRGGRLGSRLRQKGECSAAYRMSSFSRSCWRRSSRSRGKRSVLASSLLRRTARATSCTRLMR